MRGALVKDVRLPQALMPEVVLNCDRDDPGQRGHNVEAIQQALARFAAPADQALYPRSALSTYLAFDALIAHGDRHDRNWAVHVPPLETKYVEALCPSFDHAASLGFTLTDQTPLSICTTGELPLLLWRHRVAAPTRWRAFLPRLRRVNDRAPVAPA